MSGIRLVRAYPRVCDDRFTAEALYCLGLGSTMQTRLLLAVFALFLCSTWSAPVAHADTKWLSYSAAVRSYSRIAFDAAGSACMLSPGIAVVKFTAAGTLVYSAALPN